MLLPGVLTLCSGLSVALLLLEMVNACGTQGCWAGLGNSLLSTLILSWFVRQLL
jgi:hypothetical protein